MSIRLRDLLPPIHPGEMLRELWLEPFDMTPGELAERLREPLAEVEQIVSEKAGITTDMALRLGKFFRTTPELWLNMQSGYELKIRSAALQTELTDIMEIEPTEDQDS